MARVPGAELHARALLSLRVNSVKSRRASTSISFAEVCCGHASIAFIETQVVKAVIDGLLVNSWGMASVREAHLSAENDGIQKPCPPSVAAATGDLHRPSAVFAGRSPL